jgi:anaerobic selenocysteine-containing dehydrogenase
VSLTRRDFLKSTSTAGIAATTIGFAPVEAGAATLNRGGHDPKSVAITQLCNSPLRLRTVRYRAPAARKSARPHRDAQV